LEQTINNNQQEQSKDNLTMTILIIINWANGVALPRYSPTKYCESAAVQNDQGCLNLEEWRLLRHGKCWVHEAMKHIITET